MNRILWKQKILQVNWKGQVERFRYKTSHIHSISVLKWYMYMHLLSHAIRYIYLKINSADQHAFQKNTLTHGRNLQIFPGAESLDPGSEMANVLTYPI